MKIKMVVFSTIAYLCNLKQDLFFRISKIIFEIRKKPVPLRYETTFGASQTTQSVVN